MTSRFGGRRSLSAQDIFNKPLPIW
nr:unnamed protein product [Callosobruchus analis]